MNIFLIYLLKVNIALCIVFGLYMLLFRNNTLFKSKRIFLWSICIFTLIYPFISIPIENQSSFLQEINYSVIITDDIYADDLSVQAEATEAKTPITLSHIILFAYLAVSLVFITRFFIQHIALKKLIRKGKPSRIMEYDVMILPYKTTPFSFFSRIFIDQETAENSNILEVLAHEQTHVNQKHSIDVISTEIYTIFCWFNPLTWLLRKEIRLNLEYLADESVIRSGYDAEQYQFHILKLSYPKAIAKLYTGFNFSPLKKRIKMMNTKKSPTKAYLKYILFIPVILALLLINQKKVEAMPSIPDVLVKPIENLVAEVTVQVPANAKQEPAKTTTQKKTPPPPPMAPDKDGVLVHVEKMPAFPSGDKAFLAFVQQNLTYPIEAQKKGTQGTIRLRFIVEKDGTIGDVQVIRGLSPECDKAATDAVKKSPKWIPGEHKGQAVAVWYNIPVKFELTGGDNKKTTSKEPVFVNDSTMIIDVNGASYKITSYGEENESGTKTNKLRFEPVDNTKSATNISHKASVDYIARNGVYEHVEKMPAFPGGDQVFLQFVQENLRYPIEAQKKGIQGTVRLRFVVEKDGSIGDIQITRGLDPECDKAAADAVKKSPKWIPGEYKGQTVAVWYNIPIKFELQ